MLKQIVIAEVTPSLVPVNTLGASGGWFVSIGISFRSVVSPWYQGLYRRVVGVRQNGVDLTAAANVNDGNTIDGNWFFDEPNSTLYASPFFGVGWVAQGQTSRQWIGMAASWTSKTVYACVDSGDIYMRTGSGSFSALSQTSRAWRGMASLPNGDIYACVSGGDIYKRTGGSGNFNALSQTSRVWNRMCGTAAGHVYATVLGGDIYKQTNGTGNFVALGQTSRSWYGICEDPTTGDIWAVDYGGDIYKQTGGTGTFVGTSQTPRNWTEIIITESGSMYATVLGGDVYRKNPPGYSGSFSALSQTNRNWAGSALYRGLAQTDADYGDIYISVVGGDIYKREKEALSDYTTQIFVTYFFANEAVTINRLAGNPSTGIHYEPWLIGDLPTLTRESSELLSGITVIPNGDLTFTNGHGKWHFLIPTHNWKNKKIKILMAEFDDSGPVPDRPSFVEVMTMLIESPTADESKATLALFGQDRRLEKMIPSGRFEAGTYPNLGDSVGGTTKWLGWGRSTIQPDLTDTSSYGVYTVADAAYQTLFAVNSVVAINRSTEVRTTLALTTHYTVNLTTCTITIVSATYTHADYIIECDVTGKPDGGGSYIKTFGGIVKDILKTHLGYLDSDLDTTSFTNADTLAPQELSVWLKDPRTIASIFASTEPNEPSLERSVLGTIRTSVAGKWNLRVYEATPSDVSSIVLAKSDFVNFVPQPKIEGAASVAVVLYNQKQADDTWSIKSATSLDARYLYETFEEAEFYTFLRNGSDAQALADTVLPLVTVSPFSAETEIKKTTMAALLAGDFITISYDPVPMPGQAFVNKVIGVQRIDIALSPSIRIFARLTGPRLSRSDFHP